MIFLVKGREKPASVHLALLGEALPAPPFLSLPVPFKTSASNSGFFHNAEIIEIRPIFHPSSTSSVLIVKSIEAKIHPVSDRNIVLQFSVFSNRCCSQGLKAAY
jgi:hypothetical protein